MGQETNDFVVSAPSTRPTNRAGVVFEGPFHLATSLEITHMISEGAEVPVKRWKIGPANTEAKAYEAFAE